ncbi:ParA family protein [Thiospirillum jenense]|uniref:ParA family protein n=1 Tax=Thiospirillum jenense TaxID=1653858 RepID=A0A839HG91_9GAMM|nr:ParA family protein [Thiospirillum jenense]MBB1127030.1 ParA family protein [Thiospirillum jenense]
MNQVTPTAPIIIAVSNRKGGSGKTTTAVTLAASFAIDGQRTLLIDLDTQSHCALGLGITVAEEQPTAHHLFNPIAADFALTNAIVPTFWERLQLIPGDVDFQHDTAVEDEQRLARALAQPGIIDTYQIIILDTPPSLDSLLLNALTAASSALIPFIPHPLAGEGVRQLARLFFRVAMTSNANLRLLGLLPIQIDSRIGLHRRTCEQLARQFGQQRLLPGIRSDIKLAEAFHAGCPIQLYAPRSRANDDYRFMFEQIKARLRSEQLAAAGG